MSWASKFNLDGRKILPLLNCVKYRSYVTSGIAVLCHHRPNAVACVERDLDALLNFFAVPPAHWIKVRTTNVIERAFREARRRTRPMSSFSNPESCDRIIYGVIGH